VPRASHWGIWQAEAHRENSGIMEGWNNGKKYKTTVIPTFQM